MNNVLLASVIGVLLVLLTILVCINIGLSAYVAGLIAPLVALAWVHIAVKTKIVGI